ncbi:MAG TPA: integrase core domain-containing protein [Oculatellaceae cyanobacterium]
MGLQKMETVIEEFRQDFNKMRPHSSLGVLTPAEKHASYSAIKLAV